MNQFNSIFSVINTDLTKAEEMRAAAVELNRTGHTSLAIIVSQRAAFVANRAHKMVFRSQ